MRVWTWVLDSLGFEKSNGFYKRDLDLIKWMDNCIWNKISFILNITRKDSETIHTLERSLFLFFVNNIYIY